jgi:hypothetical protein
MASQGGRRNARIKANTCLRRYLPGAAGFQPVEWARSLPKPPKTFL